MTQGLGRTLLSASSLGSSRNSSVERELKTGTGPWMRVWGAGIERSSGNSQHGAAVTQGLGGSPECLFFGQQQEFLHGKGVKNWDRLPQRVLESPSLELSHEHSVLRAGDRTGVGQAGLCSGGGFPSWLLPWLTPAVPTAPPVQAGPTAGPAAGGAHPDQGQHHAGPVALHQTQQTAGQPREGVHQLQPLLPPGTCTSPSSSWEKPLTAPTAPPGSGCALACTTSLGMPQLAAQVRGALWVPKALLCPPDLQLRPHALLRDPHEAGRAPAAPRPHHHQPHHQVGAQPWAGHWVGSGGG